MGFPRILIVDDEAPLLDSLTYVFGREGFEVMTAGDAATGVEMARRGAADVIVLDLILPDGDGVEACREIRSWSHVPIVMLTARDQVADRLQGFEVGADDYLTKPFNTRELVVRVRAVLHRERRAQALLAADELLVEQMSRITSEKRIAARATPASGVSQAGLELDPRTNTVLIGERRVSLTAAEYRLLEILLRNYGRVVTRTDLSRQIWGESGESTTLLLEAVVRTACEKVEVDPARPRYLITVPGIGYRIV